MGDSSYWTRIERIGEMTLTHGDHFVILQNNEDQLYAKVVSISPAVLETHFWEEVERLQKERLVYHDAPLLILNPLRKVHTVRRPETPPTIYLSFRLLLFNEMGVC